MKRRLFKQIAIMGALLLCFSTAPEIKAQVDIYDVVGATDDIGRTERPAEKKEKASTDVKESAKESTEKPENTDVEDTKEILRDIRTMLLGILFATSWTAGAVTSGNFVKPFSKRV